MNGSYRELNHVTPNHTSSIRYSDMKTARDQLVNDDSLMKRQVEFAEKKIRQVEEYTQSKNSELESAIQEVNNGIKITTEMPVHFMYGLARKKPLYCPYNESKKTLKETLKRYAMDTSFLDFKKGQSRTWYMLYYPMEEVIFDSGRKEYFMRCKSVDRTTGQLGWHIMCVYVDNGDGTYSRPFQRFATYPS